jgi:Sec-independent protein translocase protein TatA
MGYVELFLIMVLTFIVVGPKDFPKIMFSIGDFVRRVKSVSHNFYERIEYISEHENQKK